MDKERRLLGSLISKRQGCIHQIDDVDLSMNKLREGGANNHAPVSGKFREMMGKYVEEIKGIVEEISPIDSEAMMIAREERDSLKKELLRVRHVRQATQDYKKAKIHAPRFLDTKR